MNLPSREDWIEWLVMQLVIVPSVVGISLMAGLQVLWSGPLIMMGVTAFSKLMVAPAIRQRQKDKL